MSHTYSYPRPAVTVDCLITRKVLNVKEVLLIKRLNDPFRDQWALPGGFIEMHETLVESARRELFEETELEVQELKQFHTFDELDRDPRHRTISTIFIGHIDEENVDVAAASDAKEVAWFPLSDLPVMAFDHNDILEMAIGLHVI